MSDDFAWGLFSGAFISLLVVCILRTAQIDVPLLILALMAG